MILDQAQFESRAERIQVLLSDVDGVLTDGKLIYSSDGHESKAFHVRDGLAIKLWRQCDFSFGLITARESECVARRGDELGVDFLLQKRSDKLKAIREITQSLGLALENVCYIGDDLHDLAAIEAVGLGATDADAAPEIQAAAVFQTQQNGGGGALRELVELLLKTKGLWNTLLSSFSNG